MATPPFEPAPRDLAPERKDDSMTDVTTVGHTFRTAAAVPGISCSLEHSTANVLLQRYVGNRSQQLSTCTERSVMLQR